MVMTRNQKRKSDDEPQEGVGTSVGSASNVVLVKRRKASDNTNNSGDVPQDGRDETGEELDLTSESEFQSDESTTADSVTLVSDDFTSSTSSPSTEVSDNNKDPDAGVSSSQPHVVNLKLNQKQIQTLIRCAVKQLVKQYNDNDMEFISKPAKREDEPYERFLDMVDAIYEGDFFKRIPIEDRKKRLKAKVTQQEIERVTAELEKIQGEYLESAPSILDVINLNTDTEHKKKMLESIHHFVNAEMLGFEYNKNLKYLKSNLVQTKSDELVELEKQIIQAATDSNASDSYRSRILSSKMPFYNKVVAYKKLDIMETYEDSDTSEYAKYKNWMEMLLSIPFGEYIECDVNGLSEAGDIKQYMKTVRSVLDKRLSFLEKPKDQIINVVTHMIRNPNAGINAIGLYGKKGLGKTSIVQSISEALQRPYRTISLGGESDSSMLTGHNFTYVGSIPGRIIEILRETKCMNPIILIDELDKVSQTHHGKEIIGTLIHLTDATTNSSYNYDRYFAGVEFDLSKVLFVFTYNDPSMVDKILADRLLKIKIENYNRKEKLEITQKHIIPKILKKFCFPESDVVFPLDCIEHVIETSVSDEGMRDIHRKFEIATSRINTLMMTDPNDNIVHLSYKKLYEKFNTTERPLRVERRDMDVLLNDSFETGGEQVTGPPPAGMYL